MAFAKYAGADVISFKWAPKKVASYAGYRKLADFSFNDYLTDDGYLYARVRAIASKTNKNWDSWPAEELKNAYRTFIGKPIFVDHHNHDPSRARGVVVDAELHYDDLKTSSFDPYYSSAEVDPLHLPPTWIELLLEVDAKKFPKLAKAIVSGDIDSVSMGADVGYTTCNICSHRAEDPSQFCRHIMAKGAYFDYYNSDGTKTSRRAAEHCFKVSFFEISWVFDPAEESALALDIKTAAMKPDLKEAMLRASTFDADPNERDEHAQAGEPGMAPDEPQTGRGSDLESQQVHDNRLRRLVEMGYPPELAEQIAAQEYRGYDDTTDTHYGIDVHELKRLIDNGATPEQAHGIIAKRLAARKLADNPIPQADMTRMPESVDTLRQEDVCTVCGSTMEDGECVLCGYVEPPEGFNNPDLEKAKEVDRQLHDENAGNDSQEESMDQGNEVQSDEVAGASSTAAPAVMSRYMLATTNSDETLSVKSKTSAAQPVQRINTQERPLLPVARQNSDKPLAVHTVKYPTQPVESNTKTKDNMANKKTADGATPWGDGTQAEKRVDVEGVGAVTGDPLTGIKSENVDKDTGDFTAPHTDTWGPGAGDSLGQHEPVTGDSFEGGGPIGVHARNVEATGNGPAAPGFPDSEASHVELTGPLAEEVGDRTRTDGGEQYRSLKHTEPVTTENANEVGGPIGEAEKAPLGSGGATGQSFSFAIKAMKLAETEAALGWIPNKWTRLAELEKKTEEYVDAALEAANKQRTASARRASTPHTAGRMPSFRSAGVNPEAHAVPDASTQDSLAW